MFLLERENEVDNELLFNYMLRPYKPADIELLKTIIETCVGKGNSNLTNIQNIQNIQKIQNIQNLFSQLDDLFRIKDGVKDFSFTINLKMQNTVLDDYISSIKEAIKSINGLIPNLTDEVKTSFEIFRDDYILEFKDNLVKYIISTHLIESIDGGSPAEGNTLESLLKTLNDLDGTILNKNSDGEYLFLTKMFAEE